MSLSIPSQVIEDIPAELQALVIDVLDALFLQAFKAGLHRR
jgi:hypothetical protein